MIADLEAHAACQLICSSSSSSTFFPLLPSPSSSFLSFILLSSFFFPPLKFKWIFVLLKKPWIYCRIRILTVSGHIWNVFPFLIFNISSCIRYISSHLLSVPISGTYWVWVGTFLKYPWVCSIPVVSAMGLGSIQDGKSDHISSDFQVDMYLYRHKVLWSLSKVFSIFFILVDRNI